MCGIAGIVHFDGSPIPEGLVRRMCDAIEHRGPDDSGIVDAPTADSVARGRPRAQLGNRRLSIIDVAGGHQPIANEDGTVWTVLNGEIYNFRDLRAELEAFGHRFGTRSDTEVIVHAYEQWGGQLVEHLDGMFAFALWDERAGRLILARDRFGKKPLVYINQDARLAFASEMQALLPVPDWSRTVDGDALDAYLGYMAIPAPLTIYRAVRKVPPAHVLTRDGNRMGLRRYWSLAFEPKASVNEADAEVRVQELLDAAVRRRLVSEVPLGAFLSGGLDSSAVVASMAQLSGRPVKTFSIGFDEPEYDELSHARRVADALGCEHHEFIVRPAAVEVLPALVRHFGEPFADSSAIPSWYLAKLTHEHVTVALNGDGGDELFAGYGRHLANSLAEEWGRVPAPVRQSAERIARSRLFADAGGNRLSRFSGAAGKSRGERYRAWAGVFSEDWVRELTGRAENPDSEVAREFAAAGDLDAVDGMLAVETRFYLPTDLLPKIDITSMAHSLEVRSPFLDTALAQFVATLPSRLKLKRLTTKYLLKRAVAARLPPSISRRPKRGFAVPIARWLRGDLRAFLCDHLQPATAARAGLLQQSAIDRLIAEHLSEKADYAHQLWALLMFELWHSALPI